MISYCHMEPDFTESDPKGWWLMIGWDEQPDGTMEEEWIFFPVGPQGLVT